MQNSCVQLQHSSGRHVCWTHHQCYCATIRLHSPPTAGSCFGTATMSFLLQCPPTQATPANPTQNGPSPTKATDSLAPQLLVWQRLVLLRQMLGPAAPAP